MSSWGGESQSKYMRAPQNRQVSLCHVQRRTSQWQLRGRGRTLIHTKTQRADNVADLNNLQADHDL